MDEVMMVIVDEFNQLSNYYQGKITESVLLDKTGRLAAEQLPSYHIQFHFPFVCVCVRAYLCFKFLADLYSNFI